MSEATSSASAVVLIVDDDPSLIRMIALTLRTHGYGVETAGNGQEALDRLESVRADVIVLDLAMPVMDGRTFYRKLRSQGDNTPVLLLSAHGAREAAQELLTEGYLGKPFNPDDLTAKIEMLIAS